MKKGILTILLNVLFIIGVQAQVTYTFTNAGAEGSNGPTAAQIGSAYTGTTLEGLVTSHPTYQGIQEFIVPATGTYLIQTIGATGGNQNETSIAIGQPANITGEFELTAGTKLYILVGQHGHLGSTRPGWGGGGGSFVVQDEVSSNGTTLIIAGGSGSGHTRYTQFAEEQNASVTSTLPVSRYAQPNRYGGNGAGFLVNGDVGNNGIYLPVPGNTTHTIPQSFINGGAGDEFGGGFGGGGGTTNTYGGAGGGYLGGVSANGTPLVASGGSSLNTGINQSNVLNNNDQYTMSHGAVTITELDVTPAITTTPWRMNRGRGAIAFNIGNGSLGNPIAYAQMQIPSTDDGNWGAAPLDNNGDIRFVETSILSSCRAQLDFTYFETYIDIPEDATVDELTVTFAQVDDGARAYIFNSQHPNGAFDGEITINNGVPVSRDYSQFAVAGERNRVVIVQFDSCPVGNNLVGANLNVNGTVVEVNNSAPPVVIAQNFNANLDADGNVVISASDIDNGSFSVLAGPVTLRIDQTAFSCANIGTPVQVTLTATDTNGEMSTATAMVTVVDNIPPTIITKPVTIIIPSEAGLTIDESFVVDTNAGSLTGDNCGPITYSLSKSLFTYADIADSPLAITVTGTDSNGNVTQEQALVTIQDNVDPIAITKDITAQLDENGSVSITPEQVNNGSTDNSGGTLTYSLSQTDFDCDDLTSNNSGLSFNGSSSAFGSIPYNSALTLNSFTVEAWVKTTRSTAFDRVVTKAVGGGQNYSLAVHNGKAHIRFDRVGGGQNFAESAVNVNDGEWHHLAGVHDTNANTIKIYVDGILADTRNTNGDPITGTQSLEIGRFSSSFNQNFLGDVDDVRVWNDVRTDQEVSENYNKNLSGNEAGLVAFLNMNEGSGNTASNLASTTDASLSNGVSWVSGATALDITGQVEVTLTVTDESNNSSSATALVTIEDKITPALVGVPADVKVEFDAVPAIAAVSATDNCANPSVAFTEERADGISNNDYVLTRTWIATDASGNTVSGTQVITVEDATPPSVITQDVTVYLDAAGNASITPQDVDNGSSDNSGGTLTYSLDQTTFDCNEFSVSCSGSSIEFIGSGIASGANGDNIQNLGLNQLTMEAWVKQNGGSVNSIIRKAGDYDLYIVNNIVYAEVWYEGRASSAQYLYTGPSVPSIGWSHLAFTFDKANNGAGKFYVNGNVTTVNGAARSIAPDITLGIGGSTEFGQSFTGLIDDVRIWSTERTNAQINEFKDFCIDANSVGLEAYFKIEANEGTTLTDYSGNGNHLTITGTTWSTEGAPIGSQGTEVTLTVTDASNNSSAATANIIVLDNIAPEITAPVDIDVFATSASGTVVNYTAPVGTDNCSVTTALTAGLADGATFPIGTTVVTYTATDGSGNEALASFNVNVTGIAPVITQADIIVSNDTGVCGAVVNYAATETTVGIPAANITYTVAPGSNFAVGTTTVTATATNAVGSSTSTFSVTVEDNEVPSVITKDITVALDANGNASIVPSQVDDGSDDNCSIASFALSGVQSTTETLSFQQGDGSAFSETDATQLFAFSRDQNLTSSIQLSTDDQLNGQLSLIRFSDIFGNAQGQIPAGATITSAVLEVRTFDNSSASVQNVHEVLTDWDETSVTYNSFGTTQGVQTGEDYNATPVAGFTPNAANSFASVSITDLVQSWRSGSNNGLILVNSTSDGYVFGSEDNPNASFRPKLTVTYEVAQTELNFDCSDLGDNTVTLTVTDDNGNSQTGTATVTVNDITPPNVITKDITVALDANGNASIVPSQVDDGSDDNCAIETLLFGVSGDNGGQEIVPVTSGTRSGRDLTGITYTYGGETKTLTPANAIGSQLVLSTLTAGSNAANRFWDANSTTGMTETKALGVLGDFDLGTVFQDCSDPAGVKHDVMFDTPITPGAGPEIFIVHGGLTQNIQILDTNGDVVKTLNINVNSSSSSVTIGGSAVASRFFGFYLRNNVNYAVQQLGTHGNTQNRVLALDLNASEVPEIGGIRFGGGGCNYTYEILGFQPELGTAPQLDFTCDNLGANTVTLQATDASGNVSTETATVTVIDEIVPVITAPADISVFATSAAGATVNYVTPIGTDNCSVTTALIAGLADGATFPIGTTVVTYTATDASGNSASASFNVEVAGLAPEIIVPTNITVDTDAGVCGAIVNYSATETTAIPASVITYDIQPGSSFAVGTVTVTATATNPVGTSVRTFTVTVEDNEAPIAITQPLTVQLDANGNGSITAAQVNNGSNDACGIASVSLDNSTFTCDNVGANTMTLTVTDNNGNVSTAEATITVVDSVAPVAIAQSLTVQLDAAGNGSITAEAVNNGSTDACGIASVSLDNSTFTCDNVGVNTVTLTVTDNNGNVSRAEATITVIDSVAPVAIAQPLTVQLDASGNGNITAAAVNNGSTDACGIASLSLDNSTFTCDNVGVNTVTLTVTDNNGNVSTAEATITVVDSVAPVALANDISINLKSNGTASITADMIDAGSNDACGITSLTLDILAFDCANVGVENIVTLTVIDVNGNESTATANVTVNDVTAPRIRPENITASLDENGQFSLDANNILETKDSRKGDRQATAAVKQALNRLVRERKIEQKALAILAKANANLNVQQSFVNLAQSQLDNARIALSVAEQAYADAQATGNNQLINSALRAIKLAKRSVANTSRRLRSAATQLIKRENKVLVAERNERRAAQAAFAANFRYQQAVAQQTALGEIIYLGFTNDACGIASIEASQLNFDCSNVGDNEVTLTVTDIHGNVRTDVAIVTIIDVIAPTVVTQDITVALDENGEYTISASDIDGGSFDNCTFDLTIDNDAFNCSTLGENIVNLTATDASGNVTTLPATVTVIDNAAPTIVATNIEVQLDENGSASIMVSDVDGGTYDNCAVASVTIDVNSFDCGNLGDNIVTLTATDVNGNVSTGPAVVTVVDVIAPTVGVQNISIDLDANGNATITPEDVLILSEDDIETGEDCTVSAAGSHAVWLSDYVQSDNTGEITGINNTVNNSGAGSSNLSKSWSDYYKKKKGGDKDKKKGDDDDDDKDDDDDDKGKKVKAKDTRFVFDPAGGGIHRALDGTAVVTGTIVSNTDPSDQWIVTLNLANASNWADWSAMGRSYKDEKRLAGSNYRDWTYYEMAEGSKLTGVGRNAGEVISLTHAPTNYRYGFQLGDAANSKNANFGMSGWFFYTNRAGKQVQGDFNLDVTDCQSSPAPADAVITSDNCSIASTSLSVSNFDCTNLGDNTVQVTVTDQSGNATTVPVSVTVNDRIAPTVIAQDITVSLGANGSVTVDPSLLDGGSTDNANCELTYTLDRDTFDCDDLGKGYYYSYKGKKYGNKKGHKVTLTATDRAGNSSSATAYITVIDDEAPVISSTPITVVVDGRKKAYLSKYDVENAVTDNCKVKDIYFRRMKYDRDDVGMNSVQVIARDYSGNTTTGNVMVNVIDISNYGRYVDMCYNGKTIRVKKSYVQHYLRKGASIGGCVYFAQAGSSRTIKVIEDLGTDGLAVTPDLKLLSYPNPTSGYTVISFSSQVDGAAKVSILNTNGVEMDKLFDDELVAQQEVEVGYEAGKLPSGIYIVRMVTAGEVKTIKLVVRK